MNNLRIRSISELHTADGGRNLTPVFEGGQFPVVVHVTGDEFKTVKGDKEAMKRLAVIKLSQS